jgi:hypothetical protein
MDFRAATRQRPIVSCLILVHLLFVMEAGLERMVWCHHHEGKAHLEFQISESACPCDEFDLKTARPVPSAPDQAYRRSSWKDMSCWHETIFSDVCRPSLQDPEKGSSITKQPLLEYLTAFLSAGRDIFAAPPSPASLHLFSCNRSPGEIIRC